MPNRDESIEVNGVLYVIEGDPELPEEIEPEEAPTVVDTNYERVTDGDEVTTIKLDGTPLSSSFGKVLSFRAKT